jgi:hypothetical protein
MSGAIPPLPNTPPWRGAQLKHRDNFTFTFIFSKVLLETISFLFQNENSGLEFTRYVDGQFSGGLLVLKCPSRTGAPSLCRR